MALATKYLRQATDLYDVEEMDGSFVLIRKDARQEDFDAFVRDLINEDQREFVFLPSTDGQIGYEQVVVIPT